MKVNLITTIFIGICIVIIGYGFILYETGNRNTVENTNIKEITNETVNMVNER